MSAASVTGAAHLTVGHGTAWTPGPWEARDGSLRHQHWLIDAPGRRFIATIDGPPDAEGEANGRLIARAPELLETLECALDEYEQHNGRKLDGPHWSVAARALIDKAKGV